MARTTFEEFLTFFFVSNLGVRFSHLTTFSKMENFPFFLRCSFLWLLLLLTGLKNRSVVARMLKNKIVNTETVKTVTIWYSTDFG